MKLKDEFKYSAIPALLIYCSIGSIYCWSLLYDYISPYVDGNITWAFSLSVFFLGLSSAILGPLVKRNVRLSTLITAILFGGGLILSGFACEYNNRSLFLLGYGVLMGIGMGIGYLCPIKSLMMWFRNHMGLAIGLALTGFGLAKLIASPILQFSIDSYGISSTLKNAGVFYFVLILLASCLIRKSSKEENHEKLSYERLKIWWKHRKELFLLPGLGTIWMIFFLNTTSGLAIISYERFFFSAAEIGIITGTILAAIFNSFGRFSLAWWSDSFKHEEKLLNLILSVSFISCLMAFAFSNFIPVAVLICNAGYGAMFSTMPIILYRRYGIEDISEIFGLVLSSTALAGLCGNQMANVMVGLPESSYQTLMLINVLLYGVALSLAVRLYDEAKEEEKLKVEK